MNAKAIWFDLDDTLYDRSIPFVEAYLCFDEDRAGELDTALLHQRFLQRGNEVFDASAAGTITMKEMYCYRFCKAASDLGIIYSEKQAMEFQDIYDVKMKQIHPSSTICEMLSYLSGKGVFMGIITNGPSKHQREKLMALGMERWIPAERWLISGDYRPKPDPVMFYAAERISETDQKNGNEKKNIWYAGDSLIRDAAAADACGWKTIWLNKKGENRKNKEKIPAKYPDITVNSEEEMNRAVRTIF